MNKNPEWVVKTVRAKEDYTLLLTFEDGSKRIYDAKPLLSKKIFEEFKDVSFFLKAKVDGCSVAWSDDVDIAPEHLYECSTPVNEV